MAGRLVTDAPGLPVAPALAPALLLPLLPLLLPLLPVLLLPMPAVTGLAASALFTAVVAVAPAPTATPSAAASREA